MGYVFISYSTQNQSSADAIRFFLTNNGVQTWMAPYDIPVGSKYAQMISQALKGCSCLVLMLSEDSQNSIWVAKEVERAIHYKKAILPIQLEDLVLNDEFELYISTDQIVPVRRIEESSEALQKVLHSILIYVDQKIPVNSGANTSAGISIDMRHVHAFASCGREQSIFKIKKGENGQGISVDVNFEKTRLRDEIPEYAGIYYLRQPAVDIRSLHHIKFEARSANQSILTLQVEIKPAGKAWMHETFHFSLSDTYEVCCIDAGDFEFPDTLSCVEEITFVLKPESFAHEDCLQGSLDIRNIQIV